MAFKVRNPLYADMPTSQARTGGMVKEKVVSRSARKVEPGMQPAHQEWQRQRGHAEKAWDVANLLGQARGYAKAVKSEKKSQEARRAYLGEKRRFKAEVRHGDPYTHRHARGGSRQMSRGGRR